MRKFWMYMPAFLMVVMLTGCIVNPYKNGIEALENGRYEEAAKEFKEAVKKEQNKADSYRGLGIALWETEDYDGAKKALETALKEGTGLGIVNFSRAI